jgi:hypothetical protein
MEGRRAKVVLEAETAAEGKVVMAATVVKEHHLYSCL